MYFNDELYNKDLETACGSIPHVEMLFGKKILLTGATGLIGAFIIDMLLWMNASRRASIEIYCLGRSWDRMQERFTSHKGDERLHLLVQDVVEPLKYETEFDYIIHAAGDGYPEAFRVRPVETMTPAFIGAYQLLEIAKRMQVKKFLYISSGEIYGKIIGLSHAFSETDSGLIDSMNCRSCYPMAKKAAETLCVSYNQEYGINAVIARPGHTYGAATTEGDNRASVQFLKNALRHENIIMHSKGLQMRSYTYVADCASALLTVLINGEAGEAYNIANRESKVTIAEFAGTLARIAGVEFEIREPDELQKKEFTPIEYAVLDATRLEGLGWYGRYDIITGIEHMYQIAREKRKRL